MATPARAASPGRSHPFGALRQSRSATPRAAPGARPRPESLTTPASATVTPMAAATGVVSPRRCARASSQNSTAPIGIRPASGLTPPEIHVNTGWNAHRSAAPAVSSGRSGNSSRSIASSASTVTIASRAPIPRMNVSASSVEPPTACVTP